MQNPTQLQAEPAPSWKWVLGIYALWGPPLGLLALAICLVISGETFTRGDIEMLPWMVLFAYMSGILPALASGSALIFARKRAWDRLKTVMAVCIVGITLPVILVNALPMRIEIQFDQLTSKIVIIYVTVALFSNACVSLYLTRRRLTPAEK